MHAVWYLGSRCGMQVLRGVHREHKMALRVLRGMLREYVAQHGVQLVKRKPPLTATIILGMLATATGVVYIGLRCDWSTYYLLDRYCRVGANAGRGGEPQGGHCQDVSLVRPCSRRAGSPSHRA